MILVNPNLDFNVEKCVSDKNGRFLILNLIIDELHLIMVNIYAPNNANQPVTFFKDLQNHLVDFFPRKHHRFHETLIALFRKRTRKGEHSFKKSHRKLKKFSNSPFSTTSPTFGATKIRRMNDSRGEISVLRFNDA